MQIFILGMHRSGTSLTAHLLNMMGIYFGPEGSSTGANIENPKGFWERRDVRTINDQVLQSNGFDWYKISEFEGIHQFSEESIKTFDKEAANLILNLDAHRPWFLKEPRFCINFDLWKKHLEIPLIILCFRHPIEVARSLQARNGFNIEFGLELWEKYNKHVLQSINGIPRISINHAQTVNNPTQVVDSIYNFLKYYNIPHLRIPSENELKVFIAKSLYRNKLNDQDVRFLTESQTKLWETIRSNQWESESVPKYISQNSKNILQIGEKFYTSIELLRKNNSEKDKTISEYTKQVDYLNVQLQKVKDENIKLIENIGKKEKIAEQFNISLLTKTELLNDRTQDLLNKNRKLEKDYQDLQIQIVQSKEKIKTEIELKREATEQLEKEKKGNTRLQILIQNYVEELERMAINIEKKDEELEQLKKEKEKESSRLQSEIRNYLEQIDQLKKFINLNKEKHNQIISDLKNKLKKKKRIIQKWKKIGNNPLKSLLNKFGLIKFCEKNPSNIRRIDPSLDKEYFHNHHNQITTPNHHTDKRNLSGLVIAWEMTHNPVGRAFLFSDCLKSILDIKLLGSSFAKYPSKEIWTPLNNYPITYEIFEAELFPKYLKQVKDLAWQQEMTDFVIICKPRLPSILLGLLIHKIHQSKVIIDIDDWELSFFNNYTALSLSEVENAPLLLEPYNETWTRYSETLSTKIGSKIVSNIALKNKFGGHIISHIRDEYRFDPKRYNKQAIRKQLGIPQQARVILFLGTPRPHKGFNEVAKALEAINNPDYKFLIVGELQSEQERRNFENKWLHLIANKTIMLYPNCSFLESPKYLAASDLICLIQDRGSHISQYQLPAKLIDALAMAIPVIACDVPPLRPFGDEGIIEIIPNEQDLTPAIIRIFDNYEFYKKRSQNIREKHFLNNHSYNFGRKTILKLIDNQVENEFNDEFRSLLNFLNFKFYKDSRKNSLDPNKINIVMFWKQNDTGLYGRRQEMLKKYLSKNKNVSRILHFDAPIEIQKLLSKKNVTKNSIYYQDNFIYESTLQRINGYQSNAKTTEYTFVYTKNENHPLATELSKKIEVDSLATKQDYLKFIKQKMAAAEIDESETIFWFNPVVNEFDDIMGVFSPAMVVADFIDDQRQWHQGSNQYYNIEENYKNVLKLSDINLCNSNSVLQMIEDFGFNAILVTNGYEVFDQEFLDKPRPEALKDIQTPIVGYVGNLDPKRLDIGLLESLVLKLPQYTFVIIGSAHMGEDVLKLQKYTNVRLLGVIPYEQCVEYVRCFDVGIIPHYENDLTKSMNPLKAYLYESLGVPIVSTPISGLYMYESIRIAKTVKEFEYHINECGFGRKKYKIPVNDDTWDNKIQKILPLLQN